MHMIGDFNMAMKLVILILRKIVNLLKDTLLRHPCVGVREYCEHRDPRKGGGRGREEREEGGMEPQQGGRGYMFDLCQF